MDDSKIIIKEAFGVGFKKGLITLFNRLPNITYPGNYLASEDHNMGSGVFYWRELFHVIGGFAAFAALAFVSPIVFIVALVAYKEFILDASEQPNGIDLKNVVDVIAWGAGAYLADFLFKWLV